MRRIALALLLVLPICLLLPPAGLARGGPPPLDAGTRDFDLLHLEIRVKPDIQAGTVEGRVTVEFEALVEGLRRLRLHSEDTRVLAVVDRDLTPLAWTLDRGVLTIDLPTPLGRGSGSAVTIAYRATPKRGLHFHRPTKAHPNTPLFLYSQGQRNDNRRWFPCYDLPDDRFAVDLHVTVPEGFASVANGERIAQDVTNDGRRDHWRFTDRTPSYLVSLIVAELEILRVTWRDVTLEYAAVPGQSAALEQALGDTPNMMEFFSTYLEQPYPWARYAQTFVWDFVYGGMENVTATTLNMRALHLPAARPNYASDSLVAHELAHMWFGDLLTCRTWQDIWLNEGFATYLTDLYFEHRDGNDEFLLRRRNQNQSYMNGTPRPSDLGLKRHPRGDQPLELFHGKEYNRGAAILHMLRLELGDEVFRGAVRAYVKRFRDRTVGSEDLRQTVEEVAGRDLEWFWNQWVYGAGYPVIDVRYDPRSRRLEVKQTQAHGGGQGLFRFTLPVRIDADGPVQPLRIWRGHQVFHLPAAAEGKPTRADYVRAGVSGDLLARVHVHQGPSAWQAMLDRDPDVNARLDAVAALEPHAVAALPALSRAAAKDPSWAVRKACVDVLAQFDRGIASLTALSAAGGDADPRVREAAFAGLGRRSRGEAGAVLLRAVDHETHDYPRAAAARALGRVHATGAYDALLGLLGRDSHGDVVRSGALDGLKALGDPRGAGVARTYTDYGWGKGGAQKLRKAALDCVLRLAPDAPETHAMLVALLDDPHRSMRQWAASACGTYTVRTAKRKLEHLQRHDPDGGVRHAAKKALTNL